MGKGTDADVQPLRPRALFLERGGPENSGGEALRRVPNADDLRASGASFQECDTRPALSSRGADFFGRILDADRRRLVNLVGNVKQARPSRGSWEPSWARNAPRSEPSEKRDAARGVRSVRPLRRVKLPSVGRALLPVIARATAKSGRPTGRLFRRVRLRQHLPPKRSLRQRGRPIR